MQNVFVSRWAEALISGLLLAGAIGTATQASSQPAASSAHAFLKPAVGLWWQREHNGNFWSIDVGPGAYAFVQFSTFDAGRQPIFLTMQGQLEPGDASSGSALRLRSPLYALTGGQCLSCAFQPATVAPSSYGDAEIVFSSPDRAEFLWQGERTAIERFPLYTRAADALDARLAGDYLMDWTHPSGRQLSMFVQVAQGDGHVACHGANCSTLNFVGSDLVFAGDEFSKMITGLRLQALRDQLIATYRPLPDLERAHFRTGICLSGRVAVGNGWCAPPDADPTRYPLRASGEGDGQIVLAGGDAALALGELRLRPNPIVRTAQVEVEQRSAPQRGLWWEDQRNGQFWSIDIGPGGYMFVNFGTFDANGRPTFLTMQGQFEPAASGGTVSGRLHSPLYRLTGGQCLGCSFQPAVVSPSELGEASIEFHGSQEAVFQWQGRQLAISRFPLYNRAQDAPAARLAGHYTLRTGLGTPLNFGRIEVELVDRVPRCSAAIGARVLGMVGGELQCTGCTSTAQAYELFSDLLASTELHVAPVGHSRLTAYRWTSAGCALLGPLDEREGRLELRAEGGRVYSFLPR